MVVPDKPVPSLYATTTLIQDPENEGHATGFFFGKSKRDSYLITNHHVVDPESHSRVDGTNPSEIRILIRESYSLDDFGFHDIKLYDDEGNKIWKEHPAGGDVDVIAIPLDIDLSNKGCIPFSEDDFLSDDAIIPAGEEAIIIGYPIKGEQPYIPVIRNALISSPYGSHFQNKPIFATDANMHSGTSGSPVLLSTYTLHKEDDSPTISTTRRNFLIGVHSASFHFPHSIEEEGPLNINIAWYIELLKNIIPF